MGRRKKNTKRSSVKKNWAVYLLKNTANKHTYVGATNNPRHRLRAHNGLVSGGAKYTKRMKGKGKWKFHMIVSGLGKSKALSLEWKSKKHTKGKKRVGITAAERRSSVIIPVIKKNCFDCQLVMLDSKDNILKIYSREKKKPTPRICVFGNETKEKKSGNKKQC